MSLSESKATGRRWLLTAQADIKAAEVLAGAGLHAHACFNAQQAAEKALKAVWYSRGDDPWGHSVQKMIQDLRDAGPLGSLLPDAAALDRYYIPTRYPNGLPDLTPSENYGPADSADAVRRARSIVDACAGMLA
jgi:HEPN domain-containing protein